MPLNAGTNYNPADFSTNTASMAAEMEKAFLNEYKKVMDTPDAPKTEDLNQMRMLFAAVAQGVVNYLKDHHDDFKVTVNAGGLGDYTGTVSNIE